MGSPVWTLDCARSALQRVSTGAFAQPNPALDARRQAARLFQPGKAAPNVYRVAADGGGAAERLTLSRWGQYTSSISRNGSHLFRTQFSPYADITVFADGARSLNVHQRREQPGCVTFRATAGVLSRLPAARGSSVSGSLRAPNPRCGRRPPSRCRSMAAVAPPHSGRT